MVSFEGLGLSTNAITVKLQWLEHLWDHENQFETGVFRAIEGLLKRQVRRHNRGICSIFFKMKVYCVFSLELPQRYIDKKMVYCVYTQYTIFQYKKENLPKLSQICNYGICCKGPKNEFETAVVNESSVFEPLKFYCIC